MNRYGKRLQEQWGQTPQAPSGVEDMLAFFTDLGEIVSQRVVDLMPTLAGPDVVGETYLEKVGRVNNARMRAEEIAMAEVAMPATVAEWEDRFDAWQAGHPVWAALAEYEEEMDSLDWAEETEREELAAAAREMLSAELEVVPLPPALVMICLGPRQTETSLVWSTSSQTDQEIRDVLRPIWEAIPMEVRESAWDPATGGSDYYRAVQRVQAGLPR